MLLQPKRTKFRRVHRGRREGTAHRGNAVSFGEFGLVSDGVGSWVTSNQLESARRVVTRYTRRGGKYWIRVFPDKSVTKKPAETRMGSGKGAPDHWVAVVLPGRVLIEVGGIREEDAKKALTIAGHKFPMKTKIVKREFAEGEAVVFGAKALARMGMSAAQQDAADAGDTSAFEAGFGHENEVPATEEGGSASGNHENQEHEANIRGGD